jgi:hypothetical protein
MIWCSVGDEYQASFVYATVGSSVVNRSPLPSKAIRVWPAVSWNSPAPIGYQCSSLTFGFDDRPLVVSEPSGSAETVTGEKRPATFDTAVWLVRSTR